MHKLQSDLCVIDIAVGDDFWSPCEQNVHISKYPISIGYRVMIAGNLEQNLTMIEKIWNKNDKEIHYLIN